METSGLGRIVQERNWYIYDSTNDHTILTVRGKSGQYAGIKLCRGAGDGSPVDDNNFGLLVLIMV